MKIQLLFTHLHAHGKVNEGEWKHFWSFAVKQCCSFLLIQTENIFIQQCSCLLSEQQILACLSGAFYWTCTFSTRNPNFKVLQIWRYFKEIPWSITSIKSSCFSPSQKVCSNLGLVQKWSFYFQLQHQMKEAQCSLLLVTYSFINCQCCLECVENESEPIAFYEIVPDSSSLILDTYS